MKILFKLLFVLSLSLVVLAGCGTSTVEKVDQQKEEGTQESASAEKQPEAKVFAVGDTVQFDNLHITLNGVRTSAGNDFMKPENGKFLIVDLTIENKGSESAAISTLLQMSLEDAEAFSHQVALFPDVKGSVDGELGAGRKVRGEVAFDVPNSSAYEFIFEDPFTSGQAIWKFTAR